MNFSKEELLAMVQSVMPYPEQMTDTDMTQKDSIRFTWRGSRFRVNHSLMVEEVQGGCLAGSAIALVLEAALDLAKEKAERTIVDPDERYWFIECQQLATDRTKADAQLTMAKVALVEVETARVIAEKDRIEAETERLKEEREWIEANDNSTSQATAKVSCGHCEAEFEFTGNDEGEIRIMVNNFVDEHSNCR